MDKHEIRVAVGKILDEHCRPCPTKPHPNESAKKICKDCPHYQQLRRMGDKLAHFTHPKRRPPMNDYQVIRLIKSGLNRYQLKTRYGVGYARTARLKRVIDHGSG